MAGPQPPLPNKNEMAKKFYLRSSHGLLGPTRDCASDIKFPILILRPTALRSSSDCQSYLNLRPSGYEGEYLGHKTAEISHSCSFMCRMCATGTKNCIGKHLEGGADIPTHMLKVADESACSHKRTLQSGVAESNVSALSLGCSFLLFDKLMLFLETE